MKATHPRLLLSLATWLALTPAVVGQEITYVEDLVYGRVHGAGLLTDVAYPKSDKLLPAIISVHGGRWTGGHKKDTSTIKVEQWAGFGFFAMSSDYRLVGASPAPVGKSGLDEIVARIFFWISFRSKPPVPRQAIPDGLARASDVNWLRSPSGARSPLR